LIKRIFVKAIVFLIFFLVISVILQDNRLLWGITAGIFLSVVNFYLIYILSFSILENKWKKWRLIYIFIYPFKLIFIGASMAVFLLFVKVQWIGLLLSINFILLLIIWEVLWDKKTFFGRQ